MSCCVFSASIPSTTAHLECGKSFWHGIQHSAFTQEDELSLQDKDALHWRVPMKPEPVPEEVCKSCLQGSTEVLYQREGKEELLLMHMSRGKRS